MITVELLSFESTPYDFLLECELNFQNNRFLGIPTRRSNELYQQSSFGLDGPFMGESSVIFCPGQLHIFLIQSFERQWSPGMCLPWTNLYHT